MIIRGRTKGERVMGKNIRKNHDAAFKARVALKALEGEETLVQLSSEYGIFV